MISISDPLNTYNCFYMKYFKCKINFLFVLFVLFMFSQKSAAQVAGMDSCSKLKFHSSFEEPGFKSICGSKTPDYLTMAIAVNPASGMKEIVKISEAIRNDLAVLKSNLSEIKKPAKALKFVFDHVQTTFLKQYDVDADFSDMFASGKYNCLTATILYALMLDELKTEHTIKFMPGHVYLIAYAQDVPYIFETTDPIGGFVELNKAMQSNAVKNMRLLRFMASDNGDNSSKPDFFQTYYLKLNNTGMRGLVGYQYTNASFAAMMKQDYATAYDLINKAIVLTPMPELNMMRDELLKHAIIEADKTTSYRARLLVDYYETSKNPNKKNQVADEFKQSIYQILFSSFPSPDSLKPVYTTLHDGISDPNLKAVLEDLYKNAYLYYLQTAGKTSEVFEMLYHSYVDGDRSEFVRSALDNSIRNLTDATNGGPNEVASYDTLVAKYPRLMDFDVFVYNRCQAVINAARLAFINKNAVDGERLLLKFDVDNYYDKSRPAYCNPSMVYSLAGSYYFRKNNITKAKAMLIKGLTYDPDNYELKEKLRELR